MRSTVLVVDDDERLRQTLGILIRNLGHDPLPAEGLTEARELLVARDVDLVITDLRMPGGSGMDVLTHARDAIDELQAAPDGATPRDVFGGGHRLRI